MRAGLSVKVIAAAGAAVMVLGGCSSDSDAETDDVAGADEGGQPDDDIDPDDVEENEEQPPDDGIDRPEIVLPDDVINEFEEVETDDAVERRILDDQKRYLNALDESVTQRKNDGALSFYAEDDALYADLDYIEEMKEDGLTFSGTTRYYNREADLVSDTAAEVTYCMDSAESFIVDRETGEETPESGVNTYYQSVLRLSDNGVWRTISYTSDRGVSQCD